VAYGGLIWGSVLAVARATADRLKAELRTFAQRVATGRQCDWMGFPKVEGSARMSSTRFINAPCRTGACRTPTMGRKIRRSAETPLRLDAGGGGINAGMCVRAQALFIRSGWPRCSLMNGRWLMKPAASRWP